MSTGNLSALLDPRSIAVVGASENPNKFGARPLQIMAQQGFKGAIYPINPGRETINGIRCYPDLESLPDAPDVVVVALPASEVLDIVRCAGALGAGAVVIYSSGFAETGTEGRSLQDEIASAARESGTLLLGPNCQGVATFHTGASSNFSAALIDAEIRPGSVAVIGQSGMMTGQLFRGLQEHAVGLSHVIATGNEIDVTGSQIAGHLATTPEVSSILLIIEGIKDGRHFIEAAQACASHGKQLAVLKTGRGPESAAAAQSHTAAMAVDGAVFDAVCRRFGVVQVSDLDELIGVGAVLASRRQWSSPSTALIVSNSGGIGALMADTASEIGLTLPALGVLSTEVAGEVLPGFVSAQNPLDISVLALEDPRGFGRLLEALVADDTYGQVQVFVGAHRKDPQEIADAFVEASQVSDKPLLVTWRGGDPAVRTRLQEEGVPVFEDPTRSLQAGRRLVGALLGSRPVVAPLARRVASTSGVDWSSHWDKTHEDAFTRHGVPSVPTRPVSDADEAAKASAEMGYPVALKLSSATRTHKTDFGGLVLGIEDERTLRTVFADLGQHLVEAETLIVQKMAPTGSVEVFVAMREDPTFGPVALVGTGGVLVESWNDAFAVMLPIDREELRRGLEGLTCWPQLVAQRGQPARDVDSLESVVVGLGELFLTLPSSIETLEVNPVLVARDGEGAWVADWRCDFTGTGSGA